MKRLILMALMGAGLLLFIGCSKDKGTNPSDTDRTPPVITLNGSNPMVINKLEHYLEPGATAVDNVDGNITPNIEITGHVDSSRVGYDTIVYTVADRAGNSATAHRIVQVVDSGAVNIPKSVTLLTATYTLVSPDSFRITTPDMVKCNGATDSLIPQATQNTRYILKGTDSLKLAMNSSLLLTVLSSMPSLDSATVAMVNSSVGAMAGLGIVPYAAFKAVGSANAVAGSWAFANIDLGTLRQLAPVLGLDSLVRAVDSMAAGIAGKMVLDISATTIIANVDKKYYGDAIIAGVTDTTKYSLSIASLNDSTWKVIGKKTADTVTIVAHVNGDMTWSSTTTANQPYTYRAHPATCPDPVVPDWYIAFREANKP